jgi:hypothetical protein
MKSQQTIKKFGEWVKNNFIKKSGVLWISLIGGVPGLINIIDWSKDRPEFGYHTSFLANGYSYYNVHGVMYPLKFIFLNGAVYNNGKEPLFPASFRIKVFFKKADSTLTLESYAVPDSMLKGDKKVHFENLVDMMKIVRINANDATFGCLYFPAGDNNFDLDDVKSVQLTCEDIMGISRTTKISPVSKPLRGTLLNLPKSGIRYSDTSQ